MMEELCFKKGQTALLQECRGVLSHSVLNAAIVTIYQLVGNERRLKTLK